MTEYLQQSRNYKDLCKTLINSYDKQCQGKWFLHPSTDNYYYLYLIYHAIQADDVNALQKILKDFKWMQIKLRKDKTIYNLCADMENAIHYLKSKGIKVYLAHW